MYSITDDLVSFRSHGFAYDNLNRLASASRAYCSQGYSDDGVGYRLTRVIGGTTETYAHSPAANPIHDDHGRR
jgi:hypothetical protein